MFDGINQQFWNAPVKFIGLIVLACLTFTTATLGFIENETEVWKFNHDSYVYGVRQGLKHYSQCFDLDIENTARMADGYLLKEDENEFSIKTNQVDVDRTKASKEFLEILAKNQVNVSESDLKAQDIKIIHVFTEYAWTSKNSNPKEIYYVSVIDPESQTEGALVKCNDLMAVKAKVEGSVGEVTVDIAGALSNEIHKQQKYTRGKTTGDGQKTGSSYNTYIFIGKGIPIKGRYFTKNVDLCELQTYSTERGENE